MYRIFTIIVQTNYFIFFFHSPFDASHSGMPVFSREKQSTTPSRLKRKYFVKCKESEEDVVYQRLRKF